MFLWPIKHQQSSRPASGLLTLALLAARLAGLFENFNNCMHLHECSPGQLAGAAECE